MTMIDFLLLAGLFAVSIYTVYRLFLGCRHSYPNGTQEDGVEKANSGDAGMSAVQAYASMGAPWQPRSSRDERNR